MLDHHLDHQFVCVMQVGPEVPARPIAQLNLATFVGHPFDGPEYVPVQFQHLLPDHKLELD